MERERAAIRRLRAGVVPTWELERLSVGYDGVKSQVSTALQTTRSGGQAQPLFVRGEWGTGKSHFLAYVRSASDAYGLPNAKVELNARFAALNYPQRFYRSLAETLRLQTRVGLQALMLALLGDPSKRARLAAFAKSDAARHLKVPLGMLLLRAERGEQFEVVDDPAWFTLMGGDIAWADYSYKRDEALDRLSTLGLLFAAVGLGGLVLVFDEAETIDQLWNIRSRLSAYEVMGRLCRLPSIWCVFGITDRFDRVIQNDVAKDAALLNGTGQHAAWFIRAWSNAHLPTLTPPIVDGKNAHALANAVVRLYRMAYPSASVEDRVVRGCVDEWKANPSKNPRRLIRVLIHRLDAARSL
jgi:hypothetical protein